MLISAATPGLWCPVNLKLNTASILSELIHSIITLVEIPLEISKLEGDAIFLYAIKDSDDYSWDDVAHKIGEKLIQFFEAFHDRLGSCTTRTNSRR